jgi:hypothetical protein
MNFRKEAHMKRMVVLLVALFGFASLGQAQGLSVGFHFGGPMISSSLGGHLGVNLSSTLALRANLDLAVSSGSDAAFGIDAVVAYRIPVAPDNSEVYLGGGLGVGVAGSASFSLITVVGVEIQLAPRAGFFVEFTPFEIQFSDPVRVSLGSLGFRAGMNFYI